MIDSNVEGSVNLSVAEIELIGTVLMQHGKRYSDTDFITGLRAVAALGVVLIHTGGAGLRELGGAFEQLVNFGQAGVLAFFVISGFSVSASFEKRGLKQYVIARIGRIVPLYFFWLIICIYMIGWDQVGPYSALMHFSFLSTFDARVANSIIMVEWTIAVEMLYYLVLPAFVLFVKTPARLAALVLVGFLVYRLAWFAVGSPNENSSEALPLQFSVFPYGFCFALGIAAYRIRGWLRPNAARATIVTVVVLLGLLVFLSFFDFLAVPRPVVLALVSVATFALVAFGTDEAVIMRTLLCNPIAQYLGLISYGLYLSHFPIMRWVVQPMALNGPAVFWWTLACAVAVSSMTYLVIEKPSKQLSRMSFKAA